MKLGAYVCNVCGAGVDTDSPDWKTKDGDYWHRCPEGGMAKAVLKRSQNRESEISDERDAIAAASPQIRDATRRNQLARELGGRPVQRKI